MENKKLIWDADLYTKTNQAQQRDANEWLDQILTVSKSVKNVQVIVDIGCGSGNVTSMLSRQIPHKKIFACDSDSGMISYADANYNDGTIEYFVQDIGLAWEKLDDRLKGLEGKVDIVLSNWVLHWVKDKATAAKTIARLLKTGGRCYVNVTLLRDAFEFSDDERKKLEKFCEFESQKQQQENYKSVFENSGLSQLAVEMFEKQWTFETEKELSQMWASGPSISVWETMLRPSTGTEFSAEERNEIINKMAGKTKTVYGYPCGHDHSKEPPNMTQYYEQVRIIGRK